MCIHKLIASEHKAVGEYQCAIDELGDQDGRIRRVLPPVPDIPPYRCHIQGTRRLNRHKGR